MSWNGFRVGAIGAILAMALAPGVALADSITSADVTLNDPTLTLVVTSSLPVPVTVAAGSTIQAGDPNQIGQILFQGSTDLLFPGESIAVNPTSLVYTAFGGLNGGCTLGPTYSCAGYDSGATLEFDLTFSNPGVDTIQAVGVSASGGSAYFATPTFNSLNQVFVPIGPDAFGMPNFNNGNLDWGVFTFDVTIGQSGGGGPTLPEPATLWLLGAGLVLLGLGRARVNA